MSNGTGTDMKGEGAAEGVTKKLRERRSQLIMLCPTHPDGVDPRLLD
jgi:hypothetical protein